DASQGGPPSRARAAVDRLRVGRARAVAVLANHRLHSSATAAHEVVRTFARRETAARGCEVATREVRRLRAHDAAARAVAGSDRAGSALRRAHAGRSCTAQAVRLHERIFVADTQTFEVRA